MGYDIFISYRQEKDAFLARNIKDTLTQKGYSVFLDIDELKSGKYNEQLYSIIEQCNDFLLILTPNALDKCEDEEDWIRKETEYAIERDKNIVPVLAEEFEWPTILPDGMKSLPDYEGLKVSSIYYDAFIEKMETLFLTGRSNKKGKSEEDYGKKGYDKEGYDIENYDKESEFQELLKTAYDCIAELREILNAQIPDKGKREKDTFFKLRGVMKEVYQWGELNRIAHPLISKDAFEIIDTYNIFSDLYINYVNRADRTSRKAVEIVNRLNASFQALIEIIINKVRKDPREETNRREELKNLMKNLYAYTTEFRDAVNSPDPDSGNQELKALNQMRDVGIKVYNYGEFYKVSNKELSDRAFEVVNSFNIFLNSYIAYINQRNMAERDTQPALNQTTKSFQDLIHIIAKNM